MKESVWEDITVLSEGIILLAEKAQKRLEIWGAEGLEFFNFLAPEEFLSQEPTATLGGSSGRSTSCRIIARAGSSSASRSGFGWCPMSKRTSSTST